MTGEGNGPGGPIDDELPQGVAELLGEIHELSDQITRAGARLARAERQLQALIKAPDV